MTTQRKPFSLNKQGLPNDTCLNTCQNGYARADILYAPYPDGRTIEKFDPATGADLGAFASVTSAQPEPAGLALDGAGNLYAAIYHGNAIMKFTPDGRGSVFATTGLGMPVGLAIE